MSPRTYRATVRRVAPIASAALASAVLALMLAAPAGAALSPSAYRVDALCSAPAPGYAGCLGLRLVAKQPRSLRGARASMRAARGARPAAEQIEFKTPWPGSLSPQNVLAAYGLSGVPAPADRQTLALVDAYDDPTIAHDLQVFDEQFALPACTTANGCFTKVKMRGGPGNTLPPVEPGWAQEIATDVEVAHGLCPSCAILLVEAHSNSNADLEAAELEAERLGANEISNSWGGPEQGVTGAEDDAGPFNHPGTVITVAAGDSGYLDWGLESGEQGFASYPASSPHVVAVGGTHLRRTAGGAWQEETVWNGDGAGGSGCSTALSAPPWQQSVAGWPAVGCSAHRAVADVAAVADPYTGVAVYDSTAILEGGVERLGWVTIGGTSVASPIVAATFALAGGAGEDAEGKPVAYPARTLYEHLASAPGSLHDVVLGSNGACAQEFDGATGESGCSIAEESASCAATLICLAGTGYDGPTGVGTPAGIAAFIPPGGVPEAPGGGEGGTEGTSEGSSKEGGSSGGSEAPEGGTNTAGTASGGTGAVGNPPVAVPIDVPLSRAGSNAVVPILSAPALARSATAALHRHRPRASQVAFAFTLNMAARVRVTLAKRVSARGRTRWQTLPNTLTIAGARGRDRARLSGRGRLAPGRYRLTLTPAHGTAQALMFTIG
jgi:Subtilase family